jgi:signal transduction histidine kinase
MLARTKIRISIVSLIYVIALSLYVIMHVRDGKAHGANFLYVFTIPIASILLLGMLRGIIITVTVGVIISLQMYIPCLSREEIKENGANEQTLADLAAISGESRRLAEMADGTLKILLSETEAPPDEQKNFPVDIGEISKSIARLFEPVAKRNGRKLTVAIGRDIPQIPGDPGALTQLLWNILQNAIIHSQCKNIELLVEASGLIDVTITIRDDGCGINSDILPHIFERGIVEQGGSGIGLSICREVARRHGGSIDIRSGPGSKFVI